MNQFFIIATDDCMRNKLDLLDVQLLSVSVSVSVSMSVFGSCSQQVMMTMPMMMLMLKLTTRSLVQCDVPRQL